MQTVSCILIILQITPSPKGHVKVGDQVVVNGSKKGTLKYLGSTEFAQGEWAGVELNEPTGKNDGSVNGTR